MITTTCRMALMSLGGAVGVVGVSTGGAWSVAASEAGAVAEASGRMLGTFSAVHDSTSAAATAPAAIRNRTGRRRGGLDTAPRNRAGCCHETGTKARVQADAG